jgi:molybdopterin-guanine dinucleotide biosynthesis protein A
MAKTIGVVLAGGRSLRMGTDKAQVKVGSRTMLGHVLAALAGVVDEIVVAGREDTVDGVSSLPDAGAPHRGPLAGISTAAAAHPSSILVVVAVDQPWVRPRTLQELLAIEGPLPVVPVDEGVRQTTCAVFPESAAIGDEFQAGGSIQSLLDRISFRPVIAEEWGGWGEDGRSWFSANSMAEIELGLERYGTP